MPLTTNPDEMDAPCMCICGQWFDQCEGYDSKAKGHLICEECGEKEQQEAERQETIDNHAHDLNDAIWQVNHSIKELAELGINYTITVENNSITVKQIY